MSCRFTSILELIKPGVPPPAHFFVLKREKRSSAWWSGSSWSSGTVSAVWDALGRTPGAVRGRRNRTERSGRTTGSGQTCWRSLCCCREKRQANVTSCSDSGGVYSDHVDVMGLSAYCCVLLIIVRTFNTETSARDISHQSDSYLHTFSEMRDSKTWMARAAHHL